MSDCTTSVCDTVITTNCTCKVEKDTIDLDLDATSKVTIWHDKVT